MKSETAISWELLAQEVSPSALQQLTGGTSGIGWPNHDLVTPTDRTGRYENDDPPEDE